LAGIIKRGVPENSHLTGMQRKTANTDIRVEPWWVEKIDARTITEGMRRAMPESNHEAAVADPHEAAVADPAESLAWISWLRWHFGHARLIRLRNFIVITLLTLGLWAAIWKTVASLASW
jgi:hypothetical protein